MSKPIDPERPRKFSASLGSRPPVHCPAAGKALLARLPAAEQQDLIANTTTQRIASALD